MPDSRDYLLWIDYAEDNWQVAVSVLERNPSTTAFLLHEAIEKYLKAVLLFEKKSFLPIHDLMELLSQVQNPPDNSSREMLAAQLLDVSYGVSRYPDRAIEITLENTQTVYKAALVLYVFARDRLGLEIV